jgi:hypothetical protein
VSEVFAMAVPARTRRVRIAFVCIALPLLLTSCAAPVGRTFGATAAPTQAPASTPAVSTSGSSTSVVPVTSHVHHYRALVPGGWTFTPATTAWTEKVERGPGVDDVYTSPVSPATISVASQVLPPGRTTSQWLTAYLPGPGQAQRPECFPASPTSWDAEPVTVDGHAGGQWGGEYGCSFTEVVFFASGRVYVVTAVPDPSHVSTEIFDAGVLRAFLGSIRTMDQ